MWSKTCNIYGIKLLRFDTDSFLIKCEKNEDFQIIEDYLSRSKFKYKVECSDIRLLFNFSRKSHFYSNLATSVLKICGLRMSVYDRKYLIDETK